MMNNQILISIVMPVYNAEKYLDESILSILNQTYKNFEFIIINDGSTDNSLEMITKYKKLDDRIILISRENRGLIVSLNEGIEKAKGKYIARMDADDISIPERLEKQKNHMESNKNCIVCGSYMEIFGNNIKNKIVIFPSNKHAINARLLFSVPVAHPASMIRYSILQKILERRGFIYNDSFKYIEDYELWLEILKYGDIYNISEVLLEYRNTDNSMTDIGESKVDDRFLKSCNLYNIFLEKYKIKLTEKELKLHFILTLNVRIKNSHINTNNLLNYIEILIKKFNNIEIKNKYEIESIKKLLYKKYLIVLFYNKNILYRAIFDKIFYVGVYTILKDKINI